MDVNDYTGLQASRGAFNPITSKLAPTQTVFIFGISLALINYQM